MVTRACFMVSIDLIDADCSASIGKLFQNFLISKLPLNGKINCDVLHVFQMVSGPAQENSLNQISCQSQLYIFVAFLLKETLFQYVKKTCTNNLFIMTS